MPFFIERRAASLLSLRRGLWQVRSEREAGRGRQDPGGSNPHWHWESWPTFDAPPSALRDEEREAHGQLAGLAFNDEALAGPLEGWARELAARGGGPLDVQVRLVRRATATGSASGHRFDEQGFAQVELRAHSTPPGRGALVEQTYRSLASLLADAARLEALADEAWRRASARASERPCPRGETTVLIPPGADAGVLFHELCGHPLEGDVVGRGASYLAVRRGQRVAPEFLTVIDDPTEGTGGVGYAADDEGTPARRAHLLRAGVVDEPLTSLESAARLGIEPSGHGRRTSYRHLALPRMCHTGVAAHRGRYEELLADISEGVLVGFLSPRSIHLMSGEYAFDAPECWRIADGKVTEALGPAVLRGHALETLARVDAVGEDVATFFGLKGCGKLDQPQLPVSFANPTLRFRNLWLEPA